MRRALLVVLVACTRKAAPQAVADADVPVATKEIPVVAAPTDFFPPDTFASGEAFTTA